MPAIGWVVAHPSCTVTSASGLDPTMENARDPSPAGTCSRYMYGLGLDTRSIRYTSIGSTAVSISNRCDGTTWNASPASISPTRRSTIAPYSSTVRCARCRGSGRLKVATVDGSGWPSAAVITSRRATASS
ncbi:hypothetical protein C1Y40_01211 [Mycobacterium talmoniae]|uniref:Uncharacterized protein n=1 Tax=Mycobacterium talmoniae TaxID=1858794 RepID=A0A2S8BPH9_9MYCO|nr:hypothetical protein C1Y40_01211 [Mycobacterium talmoniae]